MMLLIKNKKIRKMTFKSITAGLLCGEVISFLIWRIIYHLFMTQSRTGDEINLFSKLYFYHFIFDVMLMAIFWCVGVCKMLVEEQMRKEEE